MSLKKSDIYAGCMKLVSALFNDDLRVSLHHFGDAAVIEIVNRLIFIEDERGPVVNGRRLRSRSGQDGKTGHRSAFLIYCR